MAFGNLHEWFPNLTHVDPRLSEKDSVGSKYAVVSVSRYPTYNELQNASQSVANTKMVGLIQSFSAPQARPIQRLFELGARYPYSVAGKFMGTISMSSILFDAGANLLGGLYEEAFMIKGSEGEDPYDGRLSESGKELLNRPLLYDEGNPKTYKMSDVGGAGDGEIQKDWGAIRMSLDDNRMDIPFGLVLTLFQSSRRIKASGQDPKLNINLNSNDDFTFRAMTCLFFEMVKLQNYSFDLNANQELIGEFASFFYTGLVNIKTSLQSDAGTGNRTVIENPNSIR